MDKNRTMIARTGRDRQLYSMKTNARLVAACVALSQAGLKKDPQKFVLPKGGAESDEEISESALREAWEEAGIIGRLGRQLVTIADRRPAKSLEPGIFIPRAEYTFFEIYVDRLEEEFPEASQRKRSWMTFKQAIAALDHSPEMCQALRESSLQR